jgi:hypothetical protein
VREAPRAVERRAEGNPLAAGAFAFVAGFLAASLMRASRREEDLVEQAKERIEPYRREAMETGRQVAGELQQSAKERLHRVAETAQDAARDVKEEASETAQSLAGRARDEAEDVKEEAASSARQVKGQAKRSARTVKATAKSSK